MIVCNTRILDFPMSGVQRATLGVLNRLGDRVAQIKPATPAPGVKGHIWEQTRLPLATRGQVLWSPAATGPVLKGPQVVTVHDVAFVDHPEFFSPSFARLYQTIVPLVSRRSARVLTVSNYCKGRIVDLFGLHPDKVMVTHLAAEAHFRPASPPQIEDLRRRLNIRPLPYFMAYGGNDPRKNAATVLAAWRDLPAAVRAGAQLLMTGHSGRDHVFGSGHQVETEDSVHFVGFVEEADLPVLISGARGLIYPSHYEGFGLPVLEGMACGTPVVTSSVTSLPEVGADAALYVSPDDHQALAGHMLALLTQPDLGPDMSAKGLKRAADFSWDRTAEGVWRALEAVRSTAR